jgi:hypothetical protein
VSLELLSIRFDDAPGAPFERLVDALLAGCTG